MVDFKSMNEEELAQFVANGKAELANKQAEAKKGVIAQIHSLAKSIGAQVEISLNGKHVDRRSGKVPVKYSDGVRKWSGRGQKPRWLAAQLAAGKSLDDFRVAA